jgi:ABC-type antimicrobial peptide transport system permease subunit
MPRSPSLPLRSLRARPSRTLFTAFGIVLGVAVILAISITNLSTLDSISRLFSEASGKANLVVASSKGASARMSSPARFPSPASSSPFPPSTSRRSWPTK